MKANLTVNGEDVKCVGVYIEGRTLDDCMLVEAEREDGTPLTNDEMASVPDREVMDLFFEQWLNR